MHPRSSLVRSVTLPLVLALVGATACTGESASADVALAVEAIGTCPSGAHECAAWGASCTGNTLRTCVFDADGCRKLIAEPCSLGCASPSATGATCASCNALAEPKRSSSSGASSTFYKDVVRDGNVAIALWRGRNGIYEEPRGGFATIDLTNPDALKTLTTTTFTTNEDVRSLRIEGHRLYGIAAGTRIQVWDAQSPAEPVKLGAYVPTDRPLSLAVSGGIAFVGTNVGLDIVDLTPASGPTALSVITTSIPALSVAAARGRVAVGGDGAVEVFDVTNRANPTLMARAPLRGRNYGTAPSAIAFDGQRLFVPALSSYDSATTTTLVAFELTGLTKLEERGALAAVGNVKSLSLDGNDLVVDGGNAVFTVDVSNIALPRWKKHAYLGRDMSSAAVTSSGPLVYSSGTEGVSAIDVGRATSVTFHKKQINDILGGAVTHGSLAYLARAVSGLVVEDVRDPKNPVVLSTTKMAATSIAQDGYFAYLTVGGEGLRIYDVRSPWKPALVGQVSAPGSLGSLSLHGGRAYAACGSANVCVFDVTQPSAPTLLGTVGGKLDLLGSRYVLPTAVMRGSRLYEATAAGFAVADIGDFAAPVKLGEVMLGGYGGTSNVQLALTENHAIVAYECHYVEGDTCFDVVDIGNPTAPTKVAEAVLPYATGGTTEGYRNGHTVRRQMRVVGRYLFVTYENGRVLVVDVADPKHPTPIRELWTSLPARESFVTGRFFTTYTEASFPYPAPPEAKDQVIELCQ